MADPRGLRGRHCEAVLNCQPQAQRSLAALAHQKSPGTESGNRHQDGNEHGGTVSASVPLGVPGFELAETVAVGCSVAVGLTVGSSVGGNHTLYTPQPVTKPPTAA